MEQQELLAHATLYWASDKFEYSSNKSKHLTVPVKAMVEVIVLIYKGCF